MSSRSPARVGIAIAGVLALVLAAVGCTDDRPARAFAAFQAMAAAPDFRYTATVTSRNDGSGSEESRVEVLVVGRDSHLELQAATGNVTFEVIVLGGTTFTRDGGGAGGGGPWRQAERDANTTDFSLIVPSLAGHLEPDGMLNVEGRTLYRLVTREPVTITVSSGQPTVVSAAEFLVDVDGRPVRGILETQVPGADGSRSVSNLTFRDVGGALSVTPPDVP